MPPRRFRDRYTDALWAPNALRPNEILVALVYAKYAGAKNPQTQQRAADDVSWVEWTTLAEFTKIRARSTLSRVTQALVEAGWMVQIQPARQHRAPVYRLTIPDDPGVRGRYVCEPTDA